MEPQGYMGYEGIMLMVEMTKALGSDDDSICCVVTLLIEFIGNLV